MTELKPCPFCGGEAELDEWEEHWADNSCSKYAIISCGCGVVLFGNEYSEYDDIPKEEYEELIEAWNRRNENV